MITPGVETDALVTWGVLQWRRLKDERYAREADDWMEAWLAYDSKFGKSWANIKKGRSRRYFPISFQAVEAVTANLVQGAMPIDDWFTIVGRTPDDDKAGKYMASLLKWQHSRKGRRAKLAELIKKAAIFGSVPWALVWEEDLRTVPDMESHAANLGAFAADSEAGMSPEMPMMPVKTVRKYDGPKLIVGNIFDYVEDRTPDAKAGRLQIIRSHKTRAYLQSMAVMDPLTGYSLYENVEDLTEAPVENETSDSLKRQVDARMGLTDKVDSKVELLEFHGDFEVGGQVFMNHVMTIANRQRVIRFEPNPYFHGKSPWNLFSLYPDPMDIYGKGVLGPVLGLQDAVNCFANQSIEARALAINPKLEVLNDGLLDIDSLEDIPGALWQVNVANTFRPIVIPDTGAIGNDQVGFMAAQFNDITGALKATEMMGPDPSATLTNAIQQQANTRFAETVKHIEQTCLMPMLMMDIELNQQFMDEGLWIRVVEPNPQPTEFDPMTGMPIFYEPTGPAPMRIEPEDIRGDLDIYPQGASWVANTQQRIGQLVQAVQILGATPAAADIKWSELGKTLFEMMGVREAYRFLKTPQEKMHEYQQALAMQAQQQMGAGGGPGGAEAAQGQPGSGGPQSLPGTGGTPPGGGAVIGPTRQTRGGPQSGSEAGPY